MYVIIWEYQVIAEHVAEFEKIYSADGPWTELFQKSAAFLGTELLRDERHPHRYITIDRWASRHDYEAFLQQWKKEYAAMDAQYKALTEVETLLGKWQSPAS